MTPALLLLAALESKQAAADAGQAGDGMGSMRAVISTSLTARRWQSKTVSKALPALAPFVPRMLRDDLLTAQPHCLSGSSLHSQPSQLYSQRSSIDSDRKSCPALHDALPCSAIIASRLSKLRPTS